MKALSRIIAVGDRVTHLSTPCELLLSQPFIGSVLRLRLFSIGEGMNLTKGATFWSFTTR